MQTRLKTYGSQQDIDLALINGVEDDDTTLPEGVDRIVIPGWNPRSCTGLKGNRAGSPTFGIRKPKGVA